jgi:beta-glucanase (GH16 family)
MKCFVFFKLNLSMKTRIFQIVALFILACSSVGLVPRERRLVWSDEFNYSGPPSRKHWSYELGDGCPTNCGWGNNEAEYYTKDPKNIRVEDGFLIIEARRDSMINGKNYSSAKLVSKRKGNWKYGRMEIKAKLPKGIGSWPAIWMLPTDSKYGGWPTCGEIDIMEHVGYDPGVIHGTLHSEKYNHTKKTQKEGKITIADCQDEFHVYAIDWSESKMEFYVDDKKYHSVWKHPEDDFKGWPFDQRFYLILNIAVGGDWGGKTGIDPTIWPQQMVVDYVRVYQ